MSQPPVRHCAGCAGYRERSHGPRSLASGYLLWVKDVDTFTHHHDAPCDTDTAGRGAGPQAEGGQGDAQGQLVKGGQGVVRVQTGLCGVQGAPTESSSECQGRHQKPPNGGGSCLVPKRYSVACEAGGDRRTGAGSGTDARPLKRRR